MPPHNGLGWVLGGFCLGAHLHVCWGVGYEVVTKLSLTKDTPIVLLSFVPSISGFLVLIFSGSRGHRKGQWEDFRVGSE